VKYQNEAAPLIAEYNVRRRLSKLGYTFDGDRLSAFKAQCFVIIATELDKLELDEAKRRKTGRKR
jgi:hypothetical protein